MREKETLRPTAELPYLRLGQVSDGGCVQHGSIHKTVAIIG